jgi:hypothetical protein
MELGRSFILTDQNPQAIAVMKKRFARDKRILFIKEKAKS